MDGHHVGILPQPQRRKKTGNAEHVIEMTMRQQDAVEPPKADAAPQQLALGPLAAINQDPLAFRLHEEGWMVTFRGRNACRRPEKC
jgi:hypothetical protein